jgi:Icc-related predicted phosphoesterase
MKILAFSDLHHSRARAAPLVEEAQDADLVIAAGDFCNRRQALDDALSLLSGIAAPVVAVPGNTESADELRAAALPGMTVLHGEATEAGGLWIFGLGYGVPLTPFGDWSCDLTDEDAARLLDGCEACDLLVTHSPPKGVADLTSSGVSVGSTAIRAAIERLQPGLAVCGHIHESWGAEGTIGQTRVVNLGPTPNWFELP